jgi:hypothetical protein
MREMKLPIMLDDRLSMAMLALYCAIAAIIILISTVISHGEPLPQPMPPRGGSCPYGYTTSNGFCVPSQGASDAISKPPNGTCPWGWLSSASFCLRSGR